MRSLEFFLLTKQDVTHVVYIVRHDLLFCEQRAANLQCICVQQLLHLHSHSVLVVQDLFSNVLLDLRIHLLVRFNESYVEVEGFDGLLLCQVREHGQPGGVELGGCEVSLVLNIVQRYQPVNFFLAFV